MRHEKPKVNLTGSDGNAFVVLAKCSKAAMRAGWTSEKLDKVIAEMKAGDYDHLLRVAMTHFEVE